MAREAHLNKLPVCITGEPLTDEVKQIQKVRKGSLPGLEKLYKIQEDDPGLHKRHLLVQLIAPVPHHLPLLEDARPPDHLLPVEIGQGQLKSERVCLNTIKSFCFCLSFDGRIG